MEQAKELFWRHLESFPMHNHFLPWDYEVEFLNAITFGANGSFFVIPCAKYADFCTQKGSATSEIRHSHLLIVNVNAFFEYTRI